MKKLVFIFLMLTAFFVNAAQYPLSLGGGGIPKWETAVNYKVDEIVWEAVSLKFYKAIDAHLSGATFPPDLTFPHWEEMADNLNREADGTVNDDRIVRWDGTDGDNVQDSLVSINDAGEVAGATKLNVDNIEVDGNTITVTDLNGDLHLSGNGTGKTVIDGDLQVDGTTTTVNSTVLDVAAAKITVNVGGNQASADSGSALEIEMSDATDAKLKYDSTTTSKFSVGEIGSEKEIVTVSDIQTVTNKELGNSTAVDANLILDMVSTTKASRPCPQMTEAQRVLITPVTGSCIYNSTTKKLNIYDGSTWVSAGGGLDQWVTAFDYKINDTVHENNKIYKALTNHTSGTFATDLANSDWQELSDDLNRELDGTVVDNAITRWDGTTGDNAQNSLAILDDLGNITGLKSIKVSDEITANLLDLGQIVTPTNPAAGRDRLYFKNDDKLYGLTALGVEKEIGATLSFTNDNRLLRSDTVGPDGIQESAIVVSDLDEMTGVKAISGVDFSLATLLTFPVSAKMGTQISGAPYTGSFSLSHSGSFNFGDNGASFYGFGDNFIVPDNAGEFLLATNGKDINFAVSGDSVNPLAKVSGAGKFLEETPTNTEYKPVGEVYKGDENYFLRGQADYGLAGDWSGVSIFRDTTATNFLTGVNSVWKFINSGTVGLGTSSTIIDIPKGMRQSNIGYRFRYKYDGDDSDVDFLVQCVDDSRYIVADGDHKLSAYTATDGSALATGDFSPSGCTQVKVLFKVQVANSGKNLFFDSVVVSPADRTVKTITKTNEIALSGSDGRPYTPVTEDLYFSGTGKGWTSGADNTPNYYTVQYNNSSVSLSMSVYSLAANIEVVNVYVNGVLFKSILNNSANVYQYYIVHGSLIIPKGVLKTGDTISLRTSNAFTSQTGQAPHHYLNIVETADSDSVVRQTSSGDVDSMLRYSGTTTFTGGLISFSNQLENKGSAITTSDHTVFNINETGTYAINASIPTTLPGYWIKLTKDQPVNISDIDDSVLDKGLNSQSTGYVGAIHWQGVLQKGTKIRLWIDTGSSPTSVAKFTISKAKVNPTVVIPFDDQYQNEFSAIVKNDAGAVSLTSDDLSGFIQSVAFVSTGTVLVTWKPGFFAEIPTVTGSVINSNRDLSFSLLTTTSVTVRAQLHEGTPFDRDFSLFVSRQLSDVKKKTGFEVVRVAGTRTCIIEERSTGTGGTSAAFGIQVRTLNTKHGDCEFLNITLGTEGVGGTGNRFSLKKGKYNISCSAPTYKADRHQLSFSDFTSGVYLKHGTSRISYSGANGNSSAEVSLQLNLSSATNEYELHHSTVTSQSNGLGVSTYSEAGNPATYNVYSQCKIQKVR